MFASFSVPVLILPSNCNNNTLTLCGKTLRTPSGSISLRQLVVTDLVSLRWFRIRVDLSIWLPLRRGIPRTNPALSRKRRVLGTDSLPSLTTLKTTRSSNTFSSRRPPCAPLLATPDQFRSAVRTPANHIGDWVARIRDLKQRLRARPVRIWRSKLVSWNGNPSRPLFRWIRDDKVSLLLFCAQYLKMTTSSGLDRWSPSVVRCLQRDGASALLDVYQLCSEQVLLPSPWLLIRTQLVPKSSPSCPGPSLFDPSRFFLLGTALVLDLYPLLRLAALLSGKASPSGMSLTSF